ncbi:hypothetical protein A2W24_00455 [Microgenomates group bacterium RBG_16_45_19]|nr:MAG: hypothetical protein A2W24_00455 [Microgenomates group bacterium RBG_16_45_19]
METEEDRFLAELEARLKQNRRMVERSWLPKVLYPLASYLAFHHFRVLFLTSFGLTVILFWGWFEEIMALSKRLFLYP